MFKKAKENKKHIAFYVTMAVLVIFFWVMPMMGGPEPAVVVGEGLENVGDTFQVVFLAIKKTAIEFTSAAKEIATAIGAVASIAYAWRTFKNKKK